MPTLEYRKLTNVEEAQALAELPHWRLEDGKLARVVEFGEYKSGLAFATAVGWVADKLNHHPDILIVYGKVKVTTTTHDTGGLTPYDVELAKRIESLLR